MIEDSNQNNDEEIYVGHLFKKKTGSETGSQIGISQADHQELQNIVNQLVKLPEDLEAVKPPPKITRITHHEITAMRITQSNMPAMTVVKLDGKPRSSGLIATFEAFIGFFKTGKKNNQSEGNTNKTCH